MAYKQKGWSAFTKAEYRVNKATGIKYKATKSGIPLPGDKTEWGKKTQEEKDAWRKEQTADTPQKGDLGDAVSSAFTSSENYDGGVMKQTYGTVSPMKQLGVHHHGAPSHEMRRIKHKQNIELRKRDEENKEQLKEQAQETLIKKAEKKERKADKKEAKGRTGAAARKRRKASRLRDNASKITGDDVVATRDMMRSY